MSFDPIDLALIRKLGGGSGGGGLDLAELEKNPLSGKYVEGMGYEEDGVVHTIDPKFLPSGGGASSWNDLKDKPFYKSIEKVWFVDNEKITSSLDSSFGAFTVPISRVKVEKMPRTGSCTVSWDGVTKEHQMVRIDAMAATAFGNLGMLAAIGMPGENTGEPYLFAIMDNGYCAALTMDSAPTEHIVSIAAETDVYHTMEQAYVEAPRIDFVALGLPAIPKDGVNPVSVDCDTTAICDLLERNNIVRVRFTKHYVDGGDPLICESAALVSHEILFDKWTLLTIASDNSTARVYTFMVDGSLIWGKQVL